MEKQNNYSLNADSEFDTSNSFQLSLFSDADEMFNLWLPPIPEGFFRISPHPEHRFLNISARESKWVAACKEPAFFKDVPLEQSSEMYLSDEQLINIDFEDRLYSLYIKKYSPEQILFSNYSVISDVVIHIGSHSENDICYNNPFVSPKHAILMRSNGVWKIRNLDKSYGTYVNEKKQGDTILNSGDVIYIMGLKIIVGPSTVSVNNSEKIKINDRILREMPLAHGGNSQYYGQETTTSHNHHFNRLPRKRINISQKEITVEGPPLSMSQQRIPLMLRMGGSMVMGGAAALAGNFVTLLSSVLFPMLSSKFTDKQRDDYEQLRITKYTEYLESKRVEIAEACKEQQSILNQKYPSIETTINQSNPYYRMWERRPDDGDFLQIRLGTGTLPLSATISYPARRFELESDELEDKMYELVETPHCIENAPIVLSLIDTTVCGLLGHRQDVIEYIRQIVLQSAFYHSYDELKMVFLLSKDELEQLDGVQYLPHTWDNQRSMRFVATDEAEAYSLGEYIKTQIFENENKTRDLHQILKQRPYYLVFALDKKMFDSHAVLKEILQEDENCGVSVIVAHDDLPKESQKIIRLESNRQNVCTTMGIDGSDDVVFSVDSINGEQFSRTIKLLANTSLSAIEQTQTLPKSISFLEMFKVGRLEQLNSSKRWSESNPSKSLTTPVGVCSDESLFMLDLHEKRQGPHGLIAGMTGSGKSEFIITYILSMAVNYHPDEVAFVLIDYKGGGLAGAFENAKTGMRLPHLAGTITNLDGASIQRSLMSIESELVRRQKIFNEVKNSTNDGTIDVYSYQKLYRAGKVAEPMPHLFIISDEFAELKQQQPEFMDKLISAARIGRSLGVHLILATQKPSGVVNDQIRSNTKFRVCLRVQDRSDSMDMLKRPEAAELTDTGRFYLQVGYNEYFAMGQSAWCGAAYEPRDTVAIKRDDSIEFLDTTGQVVSKAAPAIKKTDSGMKQIVAVVQYLSDLAKKQNIQTRQLWQPELPHVLDMDQLNPNDEMDLSNPMSIRLGLMDDPENQKQFPMEINFESCQNILITGDSGSGKTLLIQNILHALSKRLEPKDFHFYVLDYSSRMMKLFKPLPHCGAVLQEEDSDSLDEFFKLINSLIAERKQLFSSLEVDSFEAARALKDIPLIMVVIDNISGLSSSKKGEAHSYKLQNYLKNSSDYGIKYIISCNHLNEISSRVRQEFGERICLHMKDKYDYSDALNCKATYLPPEKPGRGLFRHEDRPLEFQSAIVCADKDEKERTRFIKESVETMCNKYADHTEARHLPVFSETATYEDFSRQFKRGRIPLGYSRQTGKPIALPLKQYSLLSLYFGNPVGTVPIIKNILYAAQRENMELWIIKRKKNSIFDNRDGDGICVETLKNADCLPFSTENVNLLQNALLGVMSQRKEFLQNYFAEHNMNDAEEDSFVRAFPALYGSSTPILVLIESVADVCSALNAFSMIGFRDLLLRAAKRNIYIVGCFDPDAPRELSNNSLFSLFSQKEVLLFGGNLGNQTLCVVPDSLKAIKHLPYNVALMQYHAQSYSLLMPCGEVENAEIDEELRNVFED